MKCSKSFIVTVVVLLLVGGYLWYYWNEMANARVMGVARAQEGASEFIRHGTAPVVTTNSPRPYREKADELSDTEKTELTNLFITKLKPTAEQWLAVYSNRVPFNLADLTMDKFVERIGGDSKVYHAYTFVIGDITLLIEEQNGATQLQYFENCHAPTTQQADQLLITTSSE